MSKVFCIVIVLILFSKLTTAQSNAVESCFFELKKNLTFIETRNEKFLYLDSLFQVSNEFADQVVLAKAGVNLFYKDYKNGESELLSIKSLGDKSSYFLVYYNYYKGYINLINKEFLVALNCFKYVFDNSKENIRREHAESLIAFTLIEIGDFIQAKLILEKLFFNTKSNYKSQFITSLSLVNRKLGNKDEALKYLFNGIKNTDDPLKLKFYFTQIGNVYLEFKDYFNSIIFYKKALKFYGNADKEQIINNLSQALVYVDLDEARKYIDSSFILIPNDLKEINTHVKGVPYQNLAFYHSLSGNHEIAIRTIDTAMYNYCYGKSIIQELPNLRIDPFLLDDKIGLLDFLDAKIEILERADSKKLGETYQFVDEVIQNLRIDKFENSNKFFQQAQFSRIYKDAVEYFLENELYQDAYVFIQKLKDVNLLEKVHYNNLSLNSNSTLDIELDSLKNALFNLTNLKDSTSKELDQEIFNLRLQIIEKQNSFKEQDPLYYRQRFFDNSIVFEELMSICSEREILLDYYQSDDVIHLFKFTSEDYKYYKIPFDSIIQGKWKKLKEEVTTAPDIFSLKDLNFTDLKIDLASFKSKLLPFGLEDIDKLTVVTDKDLSSFPFETLVTNSKLACPYLFCSKSISYSTSANLLLYNNIESNNSALETVLVSPFESRDTEPLYLPNAIDEASYLIDNLGATRIEFKDVITLQEGLKDYNHHHFVSHAFINPEDPGQSYIDLGAENGRLYVKDIANLRLPSKLVCLSACSTGVGEYQTGEGNISLSRSFMQSGAKSVINSTHNVSDKASSSIMTSFYEQLKKGYTKSNSMAIAKRAYFTKRPSYQKHPYYWSGLVIHGNDTPLFAKPYEKWVQYGSIGIILFLIFAFVSRRFTVI